MRARAAFPYHCLLLLSFLVEGRLLAEVDSAPSEEANAEDADDDGGLRGDGGDGRDALLHHLLSHHSAQPASHP